MKNLIKETLESEFNLDNFILFTKNLFNEINIKPQEINISGGLQDHIKSLTFLGEFSDAQKKNIDIYVVELVKDSKVERARAFQRNLIAKFLKDNTKDAGLVAFYSQDNPDWRLSFVKLDYKLTDKGVKVEIGTPPKRYSFLVGETEPSHTAQKQLLPILKDQKNNLLTSEIEEAFSVEKVTKEFYEKYRRLFENLSKDLKKNRSFQIIANKENIDIDNFAKKLLGQIVFLYFLQKKGWLGVPRDKTWGQGDKFFLRTLFDKSKKEKKNFYDNYLEILFYDTLNNPRRDEVDPSFSKYFNCKIPFLNGGLFEADYDWRNTLVYLDNDIFEDTIGTFDLYNFTVKEDEPLEKEVAVDPEMLGKVFENLLPENLRKGQGTYYTPREIVHYMCQESLINHLFTETKVDIEKIRKLVTFKDVISSKGDYYQFDEKPENKQKILATTLSIREDEAKLFDKALSNIKVCDPACGSGAFLVGMLNEIIGARRMLEGRSEYHLKKETIQNCIYGVDIDPGAVEIAKLRLWLSLVVDYELRDIEPLPNLDYKIMRGNSLLEELIIGDESIKLFDERLLNVSKNNKPETLLFGGEVVEGKSGHAKNEYLENLLKEKQKELFELHSKNQLTPEKKRGLEQEMSAINKELNPKLKKSKGADCHSDLFGEKAEKYFNRLKGLHEEYFTEYDPAKKKEKRKQIENIELEFIKSSIKEKVDEIDIKIKNLNMQKPDDRKKQTGLMKKKLEYMAIPGQIHESKTRPYFLWKFNFFEVFQEKGGFDVVIANPPYVDSETMTRNEERIRSIYTSLFKAAKGNWDLFIVFIERGLNLLKSNGVITYIVPNKLIGASYSEELRSSLSKKDIKELRDFSRVKVFKDVNVYPIVFRIQNTDKKDSILMVSMSSVTDIIYKNEIPARIFYQDIYWDRYFAPKEILDIVIKISKFKPLFSYGYKVSGAATVSEAYEFKKYIIDKSSKTLNDYKKLINTGTIDRYLSLWGKQKTQYIKNSYLNPVILDKDIIKISSTRYNQSKTIKIIIGGMTKELECFYDEGQYMAGKSTQIILQNDNSKPSLKLLVSLLNSRLISFWYRNYYKSLSLAGGYLRINNSEIQTIPIPEVDSKEQKQLVDLVDKILINTQSDDYINNPAKQAKVKEYERQIDQMVYKLYSLTKEEIEIVEYFK